MKVIKPYPVNLVSSTIPEDDAPAWNNATTYAIGNKVIQNHKVYSSVKDSNTGHDPITTSIGIESWWRLLGYTNRWTMFDEAVSSQTGLVGTPNTEVSFSTTIRFDRSTGFALLNLTGHTVVVKITEEGDTSPYWERTFKLNKPMSPWWKWFFEPLSSIRDVVITDIPVAYRAQIEITVVGTGRAGVGLFVVGQQVNVGATLYGVNAGMKSYSKKTTDEFGNTFLIKRRTAKRHSCELFVHPVDADSVFSFLTDMDSVPAIWIGDNRDQANRGYQVLTVYGWLEEFSQVFAGPNQIQVNVDIQGLA